MKKYLLALLVCALILPGVTAQRYFVESTNAKLKTNLGVIHSFDDGFTTELTDGQIKVLERQGISVERIQVYQILAKPYCGDGKCTGLENVKNCPADCSGAPDPEPGSRTCYPDAQIPYGIAMVNGGNGGAGINVAVLDTGVYKDHLDLNVKLCMDATKRGITSGCVDSNGHGTHVSGTIAANGGSDGKGIYGVAPEANLWVVKVCGSGGSCMGDDIAAAIRYVSDRGANIISMSLGGNSEDSRIKSAIDYAVEKGVLVIAAAGNDGPSNGSIDYPAANPKVMAVGAINSNEDVPSWSSRGINDGDYSIEAREVEVGAPGVSVLSTAKNGCYAIMSGTSMATPHVAGLAAKLWQGNASATRIYLQNLAKNHDLHTPGDDTATGFGLPIAL